MKRYLFVVLCFISVGFLVSSCTKESETLSLPLPSQYYPLETGHAYIYRLDSFLIPIFGTDFVVHSYLAKDSIADTIRDNTNRLSYRVYRFITDTLAEQGWQPIATYYITPADHAIEVVDENNLRFIKLKEPIEDDFSWEGNSYIDTKSYNSPYQYMNGWDYTYQHVGQSYTDTISNQTYANTITVLQNDDSSGTFDPSLYGYHNYSVEVYAEGIGLVYKDFVHWTWQTDPPPAHYETDSYGIRLRLIEYR